MTVLDVRAVLAEGLALHQAGRLAEAEGRYRQALAAQPGQPDALHLLGVLAFQQSRFAEGEALVRDALAVAPEQPTFWNTLGAIERATDRRDAAVASFSRATDLAPAYAEAWANLAALHEIRADLSAEAAALAGLTAAMPTHARAWGRRGILAYQSGNVCEAADCFARVVALEPGDVEAWNNLGAVQIRLGQYADAEASLRRALALRPDFVDALNNLGNVLVAGSRWDEAAPVLERTVALGPSMANGWVNLGHARKGQERYAEAITAYERALELQPQSPMALIGLGDAHQGNNDLQLAIGCYELALAATPRDPDAYEHLEIALQRLARPPERGSAPGTVPAEAEPGGATPGSTAADLDRLVAALRQALALNPECPQTHSYLIVCLDVKGGAEAEANEERRRWNARFGGRGRDLRPAHSNDPAPDRPLRVGYVSADFRHHSAAYLILPVLRAHDRSQVSVICYSGVTAPDAITEQFRALADVWHDTARLSDDELAAQIRADEIDVLVDLSGHTRANRLLVFAQEPAPVQVTAWGYATGTGLDTMHYFLADPVVVPPEARSAYAEEVVDLPNVVCYEPPPFAPPVVPPPALERGYVTFGAFNRLPKISAEAVATWARVLAAVPDSRLVVKSGGLEHAAECDRLLDRFAEQGIDAARVTLLGATPHLEHLGAHGEIDLMLDSFPHTGGVTTLDSLLMGVPVVTLLGEGVAGRLSASFLTALGLDDLIASTTDEYVTIAACLASDLHRLTRERTTLRERLLASPIGDAQTYTRAVEAAYRRLWARWCDLAPLSAPERGVTSGGGFGLGLGRTRTGGAGRSGLRHERVGTEDAGRLGLGPDRVGNEERGRLEAGPDRVDTLKPAPTRPPAVGAGFKQPIPASPNPNLPCPPQQTIPSGPNPNLPASPQPPVPASRYPNVPRNFRSTLEQAVVHHQAGRVREATALYEAVLAARPDEPDALHLLGLVRREEGRLTEALALIGRAAAIAPGQPLFQFNLGAVQRQIGLLAEAEVSLRRALTLSPDSVESHLELGLTLLDRRQLAAAERVLRAGLALAPEHAPTHFALANLLLLAGRYREGWQEYAWRRRMSEMTEVQPAADVPRWDGSPLNGRTILLEAEQGHGDTIQFARHVPMVAQRGGRVLLRCRPEIQSLLGTLDGVDALISPGQPLPPVDCVAALPDLPLLFDTTVETIPAAFPYLQADPNRVRAWRTRLDADAPRRPSRRVGLVWAGSPDHRQNGRRSTTLADLAPLGSVPGVRFYGLQKGAPGVEALAPPTGLDFVDLGPALADFAETAAVLSVLDLVITVDTSVGHLAGALGRPAWVLPWATHDWRWLLDREDTPWYPTVRLFHQEQPNAWSPIVARVAEALAQETGVRRLLS